MRKPLMSSSFPSSFTNRGRLPSLRRACILVLLLGSGMLGAVTDDASARMVVNNVCRWFGEGPFCGGQCPGGWTAKRRSKTGDGSYCVTGSKVYCCDQKEYCVPDTAPGWRMGAQRTRNDGVIECQRCTKWGDDCRRGGAPSFNTACAHYVWEACGRTTPKRTPGGRDIGFPIPVPGGKPGPPPCEAPESDIRPVLAPAHAD